MLLRIEPDILGTERSLLFDSDRDQFIDDDTVDAWKLTHGDPGNSPSALDLFELYGMTIDLSPPERHVMSLRELRCDTSGRVMWQHLMREDDHTKWSLRIAREVSRGLSSVDTGYYTETYRHTSRVLRAMQRVGIDKRRYIRAVNGDGHIGVINVLEGFEPREDGMADPPTYDRTSSRTGRLVIAKGPNILILKRCYRKIMRSMYDGGHVLQLDYSAFEARVAMALANRAIVGDPYEYMAKTVLGGDVQRAQAKDSVLAVMFGMGVPKLCERLKCKPAQARKMIDDIKRYFGLDMIVDGLEESVLENGVIDSLYGREVRITNLARGGLYNSYVQSTAVDAALLGFAKIIDHANDLDVRIRPVFFLHDALIIDVSPEAIEKIDELMNVGTVIPRLCGSFPLKASRIDI